MQRVLMCAAIASLVFLSGISIARAESFSIEVGGLMTISGAGVTKVVVGNPKVIDVNQSGDDVVVRGLANGLAELKLIFKDGHQEMHSFRVSGGGGGKTPSASDIEELLKGVEGITIKQVGPKVIIDGNIMSEADAKRIDTIAKEVYPGGVVVMAGREFQIMKEEDNILVEFSVVEINKDNGGQLGFKWAQLLNSTGVSLGGQTQSGSPVTSQASVHLGVEGFVQAMIKDGFGKVHATHSGITVNGKEFSYLAGGEFPIESKSLQSAQVIFKEYGTKITVTPNLDKAGNMRVSIDAQVSNLSGVTAQGIPSITKSNMKTEVRMKEDDTMALTGLINKVGREEVEKLPGLGQVPGLGALFSSKDFQKGDSQGVIFIHCKRIKASDADNQRLINKPLDRFDEIDKHWWKRQ